MTDFVQKYFERPLPMLAMCSCLLADILLRTAVLTDPILHSADPTCSKELFIVWISRCRC